MSKFREKALLVLLLASFLALFTAEFTNFIQLPIELFTILSIAVVIVLSLFYSPLFLLIIGLIMGLFQHLLYIHEISNSMSVLAITSNFNQLNLIQYLSAPFVGIVLAAYNKTKKDKIIRLEDEIKLLKNDNQTKELHLRKYKNDLSELYSESV